MDLNKMDDQKKKFWCDVDGCGAGFSTLGGLNRHKRNVHWSGGFLPCPHERCQYKARNPEALSKHLRPNHRFVKIFTQPLRSYNIRGQERQFICDEPGCGAKYPYPSKLTEHRERAHWTGGPLACPYPNCQYTGGNPPRLSGHIYRIHPSTDESLRYCLFPGCRFKTVNSNDLIRHKQIFHTSNGPEGQVRIERSSTSDSLSDFISYSDSDSSHSSVARQAPLITCPVPLCQFIAQTDGHLQDHKRSVHGHARYQCANEACGQTFKLWGSYRLHMASYHQETSFSESDI